METAILCRNCFVTPKGLDPGITISKRIPGGNEGNFKDGVLRVRWEEGGNRAITSHLNWLRV